MKKELVHEGVFCIKIHLPGSGELSPWGKHVGSKIVEVDTLPRIEALTHLFGKAVP